MAVNKLKIVWKLAIPPLFTVLSQSSGNPPAARMIVMTIMNKIVPTVLNTICTTPVLLASFEEPIEQTMAVVTQVPRLIPMMIG